MPVKKPLNEREKIESEYTVRNGVIQSPGKFEGEAVYVPFYWEAFLNGMADRDNGTTLGFDVTAEDKILFPELRRRRAVKLIEDDQGFVREVH